MGHIDENGEYVPCLGDYERQEARIGGLEVQLAASNRQNFALTERIAKLEAGREELQLIARELRGMRLAGIVVRNSTLERFACRIEAALAEETKS